MKTTRLLAFFLLILLLPLGAAAEKTVVTVTCTGDFLPGSTDAQKDKDYAYQAYIEKYGYDYPFKNLQSLMANDDITLVNLECPLNDNDNPPYKSNKIFRGPTSFAKILSASSIEVANLSNNHMGNYGKAGYESTVAALEKEGVKHCGTLQEGNSWCYVDVKGVRIGFVGIIPNWNKSHPNDLKKCFDELKKKKCDVIIASVHAGTEYRGTHGTMQSGYGDKMRALGAHIVVGNHSHVPEGVRVFNGLTQLYSLGNSSFGGNVGAAKKEDVGNFKKSLYSVIAQIDLVFEDGKYTGHQLTLWPIRISGTATEKNLVNDYQPVLVEGEEAQAVMKKVQKDTAFTLKPYVDGKGAVQDFVPWSEGKKK